VVKVGLPQQDKELLAGNIGACPVRHRSQALGGLEAQAAVLLRTQKILERKGRV
jgi:hypothetical protein